MADALTLPAFAKINWILKILGRRKDGYHEVLTLLQTIDLHDLIHAEVSAGRGISLRVRGADLPETDANLIWKAAEAFRRRTGSEGHFHFELEKRIPVGAGLGGGSSDAAVALLALNSLLGRPLRSADLNFMAAGLGSDVPFFLLGGTALASGRGELLDPWDDAPQCRLLLFCPGFQIQTGEAYSLGKWPSLETALELTKAEANNRIQRFQGRISRSLPVWDLVENDFERPLLESYPELSRVRTLLTRAGCEDIVVCGSGSTTLGIPRAGQFETARTRLQNAGLGIVLPSRTLSRQDYLNRFEARITE